MELLIFVILSRKELWVELMTQSSFRNQKERLFDEDRWTAWNGRPWGDLLPERVCLSKPVGDESPHRCWHPGVERRRQHLRWVWGHLSCQPRRAAPTTSSSFCSHVHATCDSHSGHGNRTRTEPLRTPGNCSWLLWHCI